MTTVLSSWYEEPIILGLAATDIWFFLGPLFGGLVAAVITHRLARNRDIHNHELKLNYEYEIAARSVRRERLLEAYELLDQSVPDRLEFLELDPEQSFERTQKTSRAMGLVKLFGTEELCEDIDKYIDSLNGKSNFPFDQFINELRDYIRTQYGLEHTKSRYKWVDFKKKSFGSGGEKSEK